MEKYILDGKYFTDKEKTYDYLKEVFSFPNYFGKNLDGLWDSLSGMDNLYLLIRNARMIPRNLGDYGLLILDVFGDLQEQDGFEINILW